MAAKEEKSAAGAPNKGLIREPVGLVRHSFACQSFVKVFVAGAQERRRFVTYRDLRDREHSPTPSSLRSAAEAGKGGVGFRSVERMIVRRPSPNIREFVVRRAEPTRSLSDGSLLFGSDVLTLAFGAVPVAAMAWALFQSNPGQSFTLKLEHILVVALFLAFLYIKLNAVTEESLLVIKDLGIQVKTCYASGFSRTEFIPIRDVVNLVINEAVTLFQVRFYLAVVAARRTELVVVFPSLLPRSDELKVVYWETQKVLWANQYY